MIASLRCLLGVVLLAHATLGWGADVVSVEWASRHVGTDSGGGPSVAYSISADGRVVAFYSENDMGVSGPPVYGPAYVRDRASGRTIRVTPPNAPEGTTVQGGILSDQGNYLLYRYREQPHIPDLPPITVGLDVTTGAQIVLGSDLDPVELTPDGRFLLYRDHAPSGSLRLYDRVAGAEVWSQGPIGGIPVGGIGVTSDGRSIAYATTIASGTQSVVYLHDRVTGNRSTVAQGETLSAHQMSPDGRFFLLSVSDGDSFSTFSVLDRATGQRSEIPFARISAIRMSADGRFIAMEDDNTFRYDRVLGTVTEVSIGMGGQSANAPTYLADISADGQSVLFTTAATNLIPNDEDGDHDAFVARVDSSAPFGGAPRSLPGRIFARDYDSGGEGVAYHDADAINHGGQYRPGEGVDLSTSSAAGSVYLAATATGEWLKYTVSVGQAGQYRLSARVASPTAAGSFTIESGVSYIGDRFAVPNTGGFQNWRTVDLGTVTLRSGTQTLRLAITGGFNLDWIQLDAVSAPPPSVLRVNFQPASAAPVPGYLIDAGATFASRNGQAYGWNAPTETRERNAQGDQRLDTFAMMQAPSNRGGSWEIAVANGTYRVRAVCGDPSFFDGRFDLRAEGITVVRGQASSATPFIEGTVSVTVGDGRLTLSNGPDSYNTKICYLEIEGGTTPPPPPPGFAARINFQPAGVPVPTGYAADTGATFGARNGLSYGWSVAVPTRDRNAVSDQRLDTLALSQSGGANAAWELAVPNGTYDVRVVCGDPSFFDGNFRLLVEGTLAVNGTVTSAAPFREGTVRVTVADGRVTVTNGAGSYNTKVCYIEVVQVPTSAG